MHITTDRLRIIRELEGQFDTAPQATTREVKPYGQCADTPIQPHCAFARLVEQKVERPFYNPFTEKTVETQSSKVYECISKQDCDGQVRFVTNMSNMPNMVYCRRKLDK